MSGSSKNKRNLFQRRSVCVRERRKGCDADKVPGQGCAYMHTEDASSEAYDAANRDEPKHRDGTSELATPIDK